jgi:acetylglutamate kinase
LSYVVIKCGGSIFEKLPTSFYKNIAELKTTFNVKPIIVHGGGPAISSFLSRLDIETTFIDGLRVTTEPVLEIVEMVLSGAMNKQIVRRLLEVGAMGIGLSGVDGKLLEARKVPNHETLGFVGEVISVNKSLIETLLNESYIPVISPIAVDSFGQQLNINGDMVASAISKTFQAPLCMVTDVPGVMKGSEVIKRMTHHEIEKFIHEGVISGGMIPKMQAAIACLQDGVKEVVIMNGLEEDNLIKFARKESIGTTIVLEEVYSDA